MHLLAELGEEWVDFAKANGLPYVDKSTFNLLRPWMTRCNHAVSSMRSEPTPNLHVSLEVMMQIVATEETSSVRDGVAYGEALASDMLNRGTRSLTYEDVLGPGTIQQSKLQPIKIKCNADLGGNSKGWQPIRAWTFWASGYATSRGVTAGTQMPSLYKIEPFLDEVGSQHDLDILDPK